MTTTLALLTLALLMLGGLSDARAADLKDKVKVEIESVGPPTGFVCGSGHLHIKGTVQNLAGVALGQVEVAGKVFGPDDELLGTATFSTKQLLAPGQKTEIDLEFFNVMGPLILQVKKHEVEVIEVSPKE